MRWQDASEICFGLMLNKDIVPDTINPVNLMPPYDRAWKLLKDGADITVLITKVGLEPMMSAQQAANAVDKHLEWTAILESASTREQIAAALEREAKRLHKGEDIDESAIIALLEGKHTFGNRYQTLDKFEALEDPWCGTGYAPLDFHMGGLPDSSLTIIAAPPGTGKTSLLLEIAKATVRDPKQKTKKVLLYTFEMVFKQIVLRLLQVGDVTKEERARIIACEEILDVDQVYADVVRMAASEDLAFIGIDFADLMLAGEEEEASVGHLYVMMAKLAKRVHIPIILLSQLSRTYVGGIPRITNIRWSGLAEAMAALIILLYNPNQIWAQQGTDNRMPAMDGKGYLIMGKSRYGFRSGGVGAIQLDWDGESGWGTEPGDWFSLGGVG